MNDHGQGGNGKTSERITVFGLLATFGYIAFIVWYWSDRSSSMLALTPNEFGDLLAGVFAPLAFLWLVLGFIQQGIELRNSSDALWLQGEELKNSVEQQRELVEVTREQLAFESKLLAQQQEETARNAKPIFELRATGSSSVSQSSPPYVKGVCKYRFNVVNLGKPCTNAIVRKDGKQISSKATVDTGASVAFALQMLERDDAEFEIDISYLDSRLLEGKSSFNVLKNGPNFAISKLDWA